MSEDTLRSARVYRQAPVKPLVARDAPGLPWALRPGRPKGDLLDINVWLALALQEHDHHAAANMYWAQALSAREAAPAREPTLWFCRTTMLGFVRLMCQPKIVGPGALALPDAFALYKKICGAAAVGFLPEAPSCDVELETFVTSRSVPMRMWTDAWLSAQARASGLRMVTFDKDFLRFNLDSCLVIPVNGRE